MQDKVIVITGAAGVLGSAVIAALAAKGAITIGVDVGEIADGAAEMRLSGVDMANPEAATQTFCQVKKRYGRLDGLVNVAGTFRWETIADGDVATWDLLYRVNLRTALSACQAALVTFADSELAIVNVGAAAASSAGIGMGAYAASKAGVAKLTESLAQEGKKRGVRVNAVLPTIIDTPANRIDMPDAEFDDWVAPAALANVIAFLLSEDSSAVTGALIPVTGRM